jgi:hypothetical protein
MLAKNSCFQKVFLKITTDDMFAAELAESDEEIGINADILVDRRRGFYWCKVSGQEERILLVQGKWTEGEDSTGAMLVDRRRGFFWCKVSGQEAWILLVQG